MKLFKVTISAGGYQPYKHGVFEIECDETPKAYKWPGNLLAKWKLMQIDSIMRNEHCGTLHYHVYCLEHQVEQAKNNLKTQCMFKLQMFTEALEGLTKSLTP